MAGVATGAVIGAATGMGAAWEAAGELGSDGAVSAIADPAKTATPSQIAASRARFPLKECLRAMPSIILFIADQRASHAIAGGFHNLN